MCVIQTRTGKVKCFHGGFGNRDSQTYCSFKQHIMIGRNANVMRHMPQGTDPAPLGIVEDKEKDKSQSAQKDGNPMGKKTRLTNTTGFTTIPYVLHMLVSAMPQPGFLLSCLHCEMYIKRERAVSRSYTMIWQPRFITILLKHKQSVYITIQNVFL